EKGGLKVPNLEGPAADELLEQLFPGSSVANPIDFLATGTAEQLGTIIDQVNNKFVEIDAMVVIFGTPGLTEISDVYKVLDQKMKESPKPIYPVLPSVTTAATEINEFVSEGHSYFSDEVVLGSSLAQVYNTPAPAPSEYELPDLDIDCIGGIMEQADNGYLPPEKVQQILDAAGIGRTKEIVVDKKENALSFARNEGYPLVMKVVGPVHKSDVGGVVLNVNDEETVSAEFDRLMKIRDTHAVLMYPMVFGTEVFIGAKQEDKFGHLVLAGLGGIFVEILKDVNVRLAPLTKAEALDMIQKLKGYGIIKGARKQEPVNEDLFADAITRIAALVTVAPEIFEMDLNPLLGTKDSLIAVDARIRIEK
ncbi:MAG: acetate--CoA ligase family protein, partial [Bacteroidales bacterium]|nr:acetate--CoA ligase family protein [Bacteroidales bacterium]